MEKVLFLVTAGNIGGAQRHVVFSAQKAKNDGFDVLIGSGSGGWLKEEAQKRGIKFILFKNLKRSLNPFWSLLFIFELRRFVKQEKINKIFFNGSNPLFGLLGLFWLKEKSRTSFTVHGWSYLSPGFKKSFLVKSLFWFSMKIFLPLTDEVVFVCRYDRELAEKLKLVKKGEGRVEYNKIEPINFLSKEEARKELKLPENKIIIGTITRLEYAKNNEMLIGAFGKLNTNKAICVIIGSGPDEENLKFKITRLAARQENLKLEDKVFLFGDIENAAKYLKAFDIFVMTSRYEGMPYALLEAISAGLPIIATRVGGIPEVLEGKGILIEPNNIVQLTESLRILLS